MRASVEAALGGVPAEQVVFLNHRHGDRPEVVIGYGWRGQAADVAWAWDSPDEVREFAADLLREAQWLEDEIADRGEADGVGGS